MTVTVTPEAVLAALPGWESATISPLPGGLTNRTWRASAGEKSGVLKIDDGPRELPLAARCDEAIVQNTAANAGIAPRVLHAGSGFYLSEWVDGTVGTRAWLDDAANLEVIAATLKRLHALPLTGRSFDAAIAAKRYLEYASDLHAGTMSRCAEIIAASHLPQDLCCCHNDLVVENFVATPDLMFLDWEYACDNDPFFDLATIIEHHQLHDDQVSCLLTSYAGRDSRRWRARLNNQRSLYLAILYLWMGSRPDSNPAQLQNVADRLATNYS